MKHAKLFSIFILGVFFACSGCEKAATAVIQPVSTEVTPAVKIPDPPAPDGDDDGLTPATPHPATEPVIELPQEVPDYITDEGRQLILDFEGYAWRPEWPYGASGVTWGWGYDGGYQSQAVITEDWKELPQIDVARLAKVAGITGSRARDFVSKVRNILVNKEVGTRVFDHVDLPREYDNCKRAFPGFEDLKPASQAALMSLTYNRGSGMTGDSRREMRAIRDLVPKLDYNGIAKEIRKMKRLWAGTVNERGLSRRREAEARMVES